MNPQPVQIWLDGFIVQEEAASEGTRDADTTFEVTDEPDGQVITHWK
jgi:hypothetical protein